MKKKIGYVFFILLSLVRCRSKNVQSISVKQLNERMNSSSNSCIMVDVRTLGELNGHLGRIDGVINIPLQELDTRDSELEKYRDKEIIFICKSGHRSEIAAEYFAAKGYKVLSLDGGMQEYRNESGE
jgi:rhodanese-related sulfurtransferase